MSSILACALPGNGSSCMWKEEKRAEGVRVSGKDEASTIISNMQTPNHWVC